MTSQFASRPSLAAQLDRVQEGAEDDPDRYYQEVDEELKQLDEDVEASKTFRWHAPATQSRQDHHFLLYKRFTYQYVLKTDPDSVEDDEAATEHLFPASDYQGMSRRMSMFLVWAFKRAVPRARAAKTIMPRTLNHYRDSLLFWARFYYRLQGAGFPNRKLFNELVQTMRFTLSRYGQRRQRDRKSHLGIDDLKVILDMEATNNRSIDLSEQHAFLWCAGRFSALRPGSLCPQPKYARTTPLKWRDFTFKRGSIPGQFELWLRLDRANIKVTNDPTMQDDAENSSAEIVIKFPSPPANMLEFSCAHRLLVIALRRNVLEGIDSLDDLFDSDFDSVRIKENNLDDVVFIRGTPRGLGLDPQKRPLTTTAMTSYLRSRCWQAGFLQDVTWYSLRHRAATDLAGIVGLETTRLLLGHSPQSTTLEKYYLRLGSVVNTQNLLISGASASTSNLVQTDTYENLALTKLDDAGLALSRGHALDALINALILQDPHAPVSESNSKHYKNYRRRVKRVAQDALLQKESEAQRRKLTTHDIEKRKQTLETATHFANEVQKLAAQNLADEQEQEQAAGNDAAGGVGMMVDDEESLFVQDHEMTDVDQSNIQAQDDEDEEEWQGFSDGVGEAEPDIEDGIASGQLVLDGDNGITCPVDTVLDPEAAPGSVVQDASYKDLAYAGMELWLSNSLNEYSIWADQDPKCPLCQDDETVVDLKRKDHAYFSQIHLDEHLNGAFHLPITRWKRQQEATKEGKEYACSYCLDADIEPAFTAKQLKDLIAHVLQSDADHIVEHDGSNMPLISRRQRLAHDTAKAGDGWYDEDFIASIEKANEKSDKTKKSLGREGKKWLEESGTDMTPYRELVEPEPVPGQSRLVYGSHGGHELPTRHQNVLQAGSGEFEVGRVPDRFRSVIKNQDGEAHSRPLPQHLKDDLAPGTEE